MTLPTERYNSVLMTEKLLCDLIADKRIPKEIREDVRRCLRHYPSEYYLDMIAEQASEWMDNSQKKSKNG